MAARIAKEVVVESWISAACMQAHMNPGLIRLLKGLIRHLQGLIRPFKGLIRHFKGLIIKSFKCLIRPC